VPNGPVHALLEAGTAAGRRLSVAWVGQRRQSDVGACAPPMPTDSARWRTRSRSSCR